jgi:inner membrane protein
VFIAEPALWAFLFAALVIPAILGLAEREISSRRTAAPFPGRGMAIFALCGMFLLWCLRFVEHDQAEALVRNNPITIDPVIRIGAEPYLWNPFRWHVLVETANYYQSAEVDTRTGNIDSDPQTDQILKPPDTPALEAAKQTDLGKVFLDWGRWAVVQDLGQVQVIGIDPPKLPAGRTWTTIEFRDLRFAYDVLGTGSARPPRDLTGAVYIIDNQDDGGEEMGGREQR